MNWGEKQILNTQNAWPSQQLIAKEHCCEEASTLSHNFYIPCNNPAVSVIGWKGRFDKPIRMCVSCADHNIRNRGGEYIEPYTAKTKWPIRSAESLEKTWPTNPTPSSPYDSMNNDELLIEWDKLKKNVELAKEAELDLRKYIVKREFPKATEGTNTKELGAGYQLKAVQKYNYNLADNDTVEATLEKLSGMGAAGSAIADRLVSWKPNFLLTEYRQLCEDKDKGSQFASTALSIINDMLTITEAAPTLAIQEPKVKK